MLRLAHSPHRREPSAATKKPCLKPVGIIANPRSGKDIRRLVAFGSVFDNYEKINILKRVFKALDALKITEVVIMPDAFGIAQQALSDLDVTLKVDYLDMPVEDSQDDSTIAAKLMAEREMACILTLGGDGTNRAVAKTCGDVPLLPISTGTNNVFPFMIEGTLAGIAAGVLASGKMKSKENVFRHPRLDIYRNSQFLDVALVDAVVSNHDFMGSRAVYDTASVREIFLTRAETNHIGFSAVGGMLHPLKKGGGRGLHIMTGGSDQRVLAPIAPGLMDWLAIRTFRTFEVGAEIEISSAPGFLALDGEREHYIGKKDRLTVRLNSKGPLVVDIDRVLQAASETGLLVSGAKRS